MIFGWIVKTIITAAIGAITYVVTKKFTDKHWKAIVVTAVLVIVVTLAIDKIYQSNNVVKDVPEKTIPLLDIELVRAKPEPPFEHLEPELAHDMVLCNKGDVAIYGIVVYAKLLKDRNKQYLATTGQKVDNMNNFPKRIPGVLGPGECKVLHRTYSRFIGYMELTVTYRTNNTDGWYRCDFRNDRRGFYNKGCNLIKKPPI